MVKPIKALRLAIACLLLVGSSWLSGEAVSEAVAQDDVAFLFALEKSSVTLHEPVFIKLTVENTLSEKMTFDLGLNRKAHFRLTITEPGGSTLTPPALEAVGFGRSGNITLEPAATFRQDVLVNELYQFSEAGTYQLQLRVVDLALKTESGGLLSNQVVSPPMVLQVDPRDSTTLAEVCESLAEKARTSRSYPVRGENAYVLSYIVDSVAIPYLAEMANIPFLKSIAVTGLARIAKVEGLDQVIAGLERKDHELEESIRDRLECMRLGCRDGD